MVTMGGASALLRWGYHEAATLGRWTLQERVLTAAVISVDAFRVAQHPLTLVVRTEKSSWIWPITSLQLAGDTLTACLGPKET